MTLRATTIKLIATALILAGGIATAQQRPPPDGYHEIVAFDGRTTIKTGSGVKTLNITVKKIAIDSGNKSVRIPLPSKGFVILQHRAGEIEMTIGSKRFKPLEGERLTIALPESVTFKSGDDTVLVNAIILSE